MSTVNENQHPLYCIPILAEVSQYAAGKPAWDKINVKAMEIALNHLHQQGSLEGDYDLAAMESRIRPLQDQITTSLSVYEFNLRQRGLSKICALAGLPETYSEQDLVNHLVNDLVTHGLTTKNQEIIKNCIQANRMDLVAVIDQTCAKKGHRNLLLDIFSAPEYVQKGLAFRKASERLANKEPLHQREDALVNLLEQGNFEGAKILLHMLDSKISDMTVFEAYTKLILSPKINPDALNFLHERFKERFSEDFIHFILDASAKAGHTEGVRLLQERFADRLG